MDEKRKKILVKIVNLAFTECLEKNKKGESSIIYRALQYGEKYNVTRKEIKSIINQPIKDLL